MLSTDEAKEQLTKYRAATPTGVRSLVKRFGNPRLSEVLSIWIARPRQVDEAMLADTLDASGYPELLKAFKPLAPKLAEPLARWWGWGQKGPYQVGWARRGFRSPLSADTLRARMAPLRTLLRLGRDFPQDVVWFAGWSAHLDALGFGAQVMGGLFASEIDAGNQGVADSLLQCMVGGHPVGRPSSEGFSALLQADRPDCWAEVTDVLRNAGRQEGVRSAVLEAADLAHPGAFRAVLQTVVADNLTRFAGTVRAAGVWFGEELDIRSASQLTQNLATLAAALDAPDAPIPTDDPVTTFLALWAFAFHDARGAIEAARPLVTDENASTRRAATRLLAELGLVGARDVLRPALQDLDEQVFATALSAWPTNPNARDTDARLDDTAAEGLIVRMAELGKARPIETGIVGRRRVSIGTTAVADVVLANHGARPETRVLAAASSNGRHSAALRLAHDPDRNRAALFALLADPASNVRNTAFNALLGVEALSTGEADHLVHSLRRKSGDLRRHAITLLQRQDAQAIDHCVRNLSAGTEEQQRAARELAVASGLAPDSGSTDGFPASLRYSVEDRTPAVRPPDQPPGRFDAYHAGCRLVTTSLKAWLAEHADVEVQTSDGVVLLQNLRQLDGMKRDDHSLPLAEILDPWWERTAPHLTDGGIELALLDFGGTWKDQAWALKASFALTGNRQAITKDSGVAWQLIRRLSVRHFRPSWNSVLLDAAEAVWHGLPIEQLSGPPPVVSSRGREFRPTDRHFDPRNAFATPERLLDVDSLDTASLTRVWHLLRFLDEPEGTIDVLEGPTVTVTPQFFYGHGSAMPVVQPDQPHRHRASIRTVVRAFDRGIATRADVIDALVEVPNAERGSFGWGRGDLGDVTAPHLPDWATSPGFQAIVDEVRQGALAGELDRGDLPGPLTATAAKLRSACGVDSLVLVLRALGKRPLTRGYSWTSSRESSLSHLARIHQPGQQDEPGYLTAAFAEAGIREQRAIEYGVYAPQWANLIEGHLGWPGFESAVWWIHAHTNDDSWTVDMQLRREWSSSVSQRTPLDSVDLVRGAADVVWFRHVISELGLDRFETVLSAAKYASSAGGHKRAELYARALLDAVPEAEILDRVQGKRHQDSVRALGLLPLSGRDDPALLVRYELLRGFVATDRTSGSQRRASEAGAVEIGLENLARSAGYADPQRLTWAMEAEAVRDLARGPLEAWDGDLCVSLSLSPRGSPELAVRRGAKMLKSIPPASAKLPEISALRQRATKLRQQARRMGQSLERACVTGESFAADDYAELLGHPVLAPMLKDVVFATSEGVLGFASADAGVLLGPDGSRRPSDGSALHVAHPVDLLASDEWPDFQHALFLAKRTQPFRQLFRELYVPNANESTLEVAHGPQSRRYAGHQIEPRRAAGLFTARGWMADFQVGFSKTFHTEKITVWVSVLDGIGTALEAEDAMVDTVTFVAAGTWTAIPLPNVPSRLFSEVMRDLDLVVSVAHSGATDPETSESSIEMRRRLADETVDLLGLSNVEFTDHHARIRGTLGNYSVHLGSGQVHRIPGNALCIIPIGAQHRGRIFLPFADDDPRTAEIISKIVLLSRDNRIQDPSILSQLS